MALDAMNQVLVVAAHPDNKVIGCGGKIARHSDSMDKVQILIVAEGSTLHKQERDCIQVRDELLAFAKAAQTAGSFLGAADVELVDFPDNLLDSLDRLHLIKQIEECVEPYQPEFVYDHHAGGVNVAYLRLCEAVVTPCRPTPGHVVKRLLSVQVASSTEWQPPWSVWAFLPNWFVDISDQWERKRDALVAFFSEMSNWPYLRTFEAVEHLGCLLRYGQVDFEAAAVFCMARQLV